MGWDRKWGVGCPGKRLHGVMSGGMGQSWVGRRQGSVGLRIVALAALTTDTTRSLTVMNLYFSLMNRFQGVDSVSPSAGSVSQDGGLAG